MTWLAPKLRDRIEIRGAIQTPDSAGGFNQTYQTYATVWAGVRTISQGQYLRGRQVGEGDTHVVTIRKTAVSIFGRGFSEGFDLAQFKMADLNPMKTEFFLFVQKTPPALGGFDQGFSFGFDRYTGISEKGKLLRVIRIVEKDERGEYLDVHAKEVEEHGTGWPQ